MGVASVLIVGGATGSTGRSISDALLSEPDKFRVIASSRPSSLQEPSVSALVSRGAEIRPIDLATATLDELNALLKGVEIVISTITWNQLGLQYPLIDATKRAGTVRRFIPSDWSPACVKGVRKLHDEKLVIHEYIIKSGLGYAFIDAGFWFTLALPPVSASPLTKPSARARHIPLMRIGSGDVKYATIHPADIGLFVLRILQDERTLNKYVFIYAEEVTQSSAFALARRVSSLAGKSIPDLLDVSEEAVKELLKTSNPGSFEFANWDYLQSVWIRGDNTIANAKKEEYGSALDARELYPDVKVKSLEEYAREVYGLI